MLTKIQKLFTSSYPFSQASKHILQDMWLTLKLGSHLGGTTLQKFLDRHLRIILIILSTVLGLLLILRILLILSELGGMNLILGIIWCITISMSLILPLILFIRLRT